MLSTLIAAFYVLLIGYWIYVHVSYALILQRKLPDNFDNGSLETIALIVGNKGIDHGLCKKYKSVESEKLFVAR